MFGIIQQAITNFIIKPKIRKQIEEEFAKNPPKAQKVTKDVTPMASSAIQTPTKKKQPQCR